MKRLKNSSEIFFWFLYHFMLALLYIAQYGQGYKREKTYQSHRTRYSNVQEKLKWLIDLARLRNCPYNPEADIEINRVFSFPTQRY